MQNYIPLIAISFLIGLGATHMYVPNLMLSYVLTALAILIIVLRRNLLLLAVASFLFGLCYMSFNIHQHLAHQLAGELENKPLVCIGTIKSVVDVTENKSHFLFAITDPQDLPRVVSLNWYKAPASLQPGDQWQLTVRLKQPHGYANPGSFDLEKYCFSERIDALGTVVVKKGNNNLLSRSWNVNQLRQSIRQKLKSDNTYSGIVIALLLGIKADITREQQAVLQNTGTAHLMAISGLHIGMVTAIVFFILKLGCRLLPPQYLKLPAPWLAAAGALLVGIIYALLAGFSVATQRALIMVIIMLAGILLSRKISALHSYFLALLFVLIWDPFAILSVGFWLSFCAVGCLMYAFAGRGQLRKPWRWLMPQLVIAAGLLPASILFFQQSSIVAPIANLIAIPWVSFTVVPFCLLGLPVIAQFNLAILWPFLEYLNNAPLYNWSLPSDYLYLRITCAILGFIWLFVPRGISGRILGVLGFLPLFFVQIPQVAFRTAEFALLDVGQGLSAVIRTQKHTLVYDTGTPGIGRQVIAPYLRSVGINKIDMLMISHADNDHIGGAASLLELITPRIIMTSDPSKFLLAQQCHAGQHWQWDGVDFLVLHPTADFISKKKNDQSCVLMVVAGDHKILLTGDIETTSERQLIARHGADLQADVLLVPHHGSRTSSSPEFIEQVQPKLAIIPVGYKNRYGHPKVQVLERYVERQIPVFRTDGGGAIMLTLGKQDLVANTYRSQSKRPFWQH